MKTVVYIRVDKRLVDFPVGLQSLFIGRPALVDARIQPGVMQHDGSLDPAHFIGARLTPVKGHRCPQPGYATAAALATLPP